MMVADQAAFHGGHTEMRDKEINKHTNVKGWHPLPYQPNYEEFHPCIHRWLKEHKPGMLPKAATRFTLQPLSEKIVTLALPLPRRLLALWLSHGETLSTKKKNVLLNQLLNYGLTKEELERLLKEEHKKEEIRRKKADAGPFDVFDDEGNIIMGRSTNSRKGRHKRVNDKNIKKKVKNSKRKTKTGEKSVKTTKKKVKSIKKEIKTDKKNVKGNKEEIVKNKGKKNKIDTEKLPKKHSQEYIGFKPGRPGNLSTGWPHYIGMQVLFHTWACADGPVDECFLSRASAYFDVQASAILEGLTRALGMSSPSQGKLTPLETSIVLFSLNLVVFIAQRVVTPAQSIPDREIPKLLELRGGELVPKINAKKKNTIEWKKEEAVESVLATPCDRQRRWTEQKIPSVTPQKLGGATSSTVSEVTESNIRISLRSFIEKKDACDISCVDESGSTSAINLARFSSADELHFLQSAKYYNPRAPEFMYNGPRITPRDVAFLDVDGTTRWQLENVYTFAPQPIVPESVPQFHPELRPRSQSGNERKKMKEDPGVWYIMSDPQFYQGKAVNWPTAATVEQIGMLLDMVHTMVRLPKLSVNRLLELVAEFCEAITMAEDGEEITTEDQVLDNKNTIILEKIFLGFFGSAFRDYNSETANYMRIICHRGAVLIRNLYEYTARKLWSLQQYQETKPSVPESIEPEPEPKSEDNPEALVGWDAWLQFLRQTSDTAKQWQQWLSEATEAYGLPEDRSSLINEAENWLLLGENTRKEAMELANEVQNLQPILHRPLNRSLWNESISEKSHESRWDTEE